MAQSAAEQHTVTNLAQAGVSEYKIYKQLLSVNNLSVFDAVIVAHTSPYRVPTRLHPVHFNDVLHNKSDLIYTDIEYHSFQLKNMFNRSLCAAKKFFTYHFDEEFFEVSYGLFRDKINTILADKKVITLATFDTWASTEKYVLDFVDLLNTQPGLINHYSKEGNQTVYDTVIATLKLISKETKQ